MAEIMVVNVGQWTVVHILWLGGILAYLLLRKDYIEYKYYILIEPLFPVWVGEVKN